MSEAPAAPAAGRPRPVARDALPPWRTALALTAALLLAFAAIEVAAGRLGDLEPALARRLQREVSIGVVMTLLVGYVVGAWLSLRAATRRHVVALGPSLGLEGAPLRELAARAASPGPVSRALTSLLGIALAIALASRVNEHGYRDWLRADYWIPETGWAWATMVFVGAGVGLVSVTAMHASLTFRTLARRVERVDLLDLAPLAPFVRQGMHASLLWLGLVAILALLLVNRDFGTPVVGTLVCGAVVSVLSLSLPLSGIRERLRAAKQAELAAVRDAIRRAREPLTGDGVARLPGLLAWEERVSGVPEWLLDTPTLLRFVLYLAIPLASWVGGALVERLVSAALD